MGILVPKKQRIYGMLDITWHSILTYLKSHHWTSHDFYLYLENLHRYCFGGVLSYFYIK